MTIDVRHDHVGITLAADMLLAVADLNDALARLQARGVAPFAEPLQIGPIGRRIAFIVDDVGTIIELTAAIRNATRRP
ncbi:VOC family protein [Streptomyces poonensis]|nr:hypothetical protein [Streptomyces poonensis]